MAPLAASQVICFHQWFLEIFDFLFWTQKSKEMRFELSEEKSFLWKMSSNVKYYKVFNITDELLNDQISTSLNFSEKSDYNSFPLSMQKLSLLKVEDLTGLDDTQELTNSTLADNWFTNLII